MNSYIKQKLFPVSDSGFGSVPKEMTWMS